MDNKSFLLLTAVAGVIYMATRPKTTAPLKPGFTPAPLPAAQGKD